MSKKPCFQLFIWTLYLLFLLILVNVLTIRYYRTCKHVSSTKKPRWWVVYCVSRVTKINAEEQEQHSCGTNKRRRCAGAGSTCKLWLPVNIGQVNITPRHTTDATGLATFKYLRQTFILYVCLWNGLTNLTSLGHYGPSRVNSRQNNIAGSTTSYFIYICLLQTY